MTICIPWPGHIGKDGYGRDYFNGKWVRTHRVSHELFKGPVPAGLSVDHICHNADQDCAGGPSCPHRACVNPEHLEAVPLGVNGLRGKGPAAVNARKVACKRGHAFEGNTYFDGRGRQCRTCVLARNRAALRRAMADPVKAAELRRKNTEKNRRWRAAKAVV